MMLTISQLQATKRHKMRKINYLLTLLCLFVANSSVFAQATAQISGTVKDQSGAVLPGVEVTATQTDTGITRATVTNETGSYVLPNLVTGQKNLGPPLP